MFMHALLAAAAGYLIGSIPFGWLVARAKGVDIFRAGSGNIGATNVGRVLGRPFGYAVFVLDLLKGAIPTSVAFAVSGEDVAVAAGLAAVLGHMFSVFLRFRGGKGVATGTGVVGLLFPLPALFAAIAFVGIILGGRIMSLAAVLATIVLACVRIVLVPDFTNIGTLFAIAAAGLIVWAHRGNLGRLRRGEERVLISMDRLSRFAPGLHALAVGLWSGAGVFFSLLAAPQLFTTCNAVAADPPAWLNLGEAPTDLGNRLAGLAVGPLFPPYFMLQAVCGLMATGVAIGWACAAPGRLTRIRMWLLIAALVLVAIGWPIAQHVSMLRAERYAADPAVSTAARAAFGAWHGVSLVLNLASVVLVAGGLALAGYPAALRRSQ